MARTTFTATTTAASGTVLAAAAAVDGSNGNDWTNTGRELVEITNSAASSITATFITNGTYTVGSTAYAVNDLTVVVAAGTTKVCGPFDRTLFSGTGTTVQVDWSTGAGVLARVITLGSS